MSEQQSCRVGVRIAELRKIHGFTQQALAVRANVSYSLLRKVERGERSASPSFIAAIARALGVSVLDITEQPYGAHDARTTSEQAGVPVLRQALVEGDDPELDTSLRPLDDLRAAVAEIKEFDRRTKYAEVVRALPDVLRHLHRAVLDLPSDTLAAKTGHTVRHQYKEPDAPDVLPPADAMVVAPITCNSLAKWAAGISDTLPLGLLVEAVGKHQPVVAMPFSNRAQISFPAIREAMRKLTAWGVTVLVGDDIYKQHEPGTGDNYVHLFPWHLAWQALRQHPWLDLASGEGEVVRGSGADPEIDR